MAAVDEVHAREHAGPHPANEAAVHGRTMNTDLGELPSRDESELAVGGFANETP